MSILGYIFTITDNIYYLICLSMFGREYSFFKFRLETFETLVNFCFKLGSRYFNTYN